MVNLKSKYVCSVFYHDFQCQAIICEIISSVLISLTKFLIGNKSFFHQENQRAKVSEKRSTPPNHLSFAIESFAALTSPLSPTFL